MQYHQQMAFMLSSQTLRRFLSVCYSLKVRIEIALIFPLSRLIHWHTCHTILKRYKSSVPFYRKSFLTNLQ
ncbi:hypothetical protein BJX66DRAFT_312944 [Aspergillus keveii]|uniref:Uncharacterized protein n=1 Tax=Aspergillus keveii TaxID=714993 RepID=A0ABR4FSZ9_9EURO